MITDMQIWTPENVVTHVDNGCIPNIVKFRDNGWSDYHNHRPNFITDDDVFLSGYVDKETNVTYETHDFWVRFEGSGRRYTAMLIVHNGSGTSVLRVNHHVARGLKALIEAGQLIPAYHLAWGLFDVARDARQMGANQIKNAFVTGTLKKKRRNGHYYVTIERTNEAGQETVQHV